MMHVELPGGAWGYAPQEFFYLYALRLLVVASGGPKMLEISY